MERQGFALSSGGDLYVYQEITGSTSTALGIDNADSGKLKLHVINGIGCLPDSSSQIAIDPNTNVVTITNLEVTGTIVIDGFGAGAVVSDNTGTISSVNSVSTYVLTSNGAGLAPSFQPVSGSGAVTSVSGGNNITITGTATAPIVNVSGTTNHNVQIGNSTNSLTSVAPSATSGVSLISQGSSSDPLFGTVVVAGGGTGDVSFTTYAPVCGGTTTTNPLQSATTGMSNSGYVLTSTGSGSLPSFQTVSASGAVTSVGAGNNISITGTATAPVVNVAGTTQHAVQIGNATNSLTSLAVGTNGQVLIGATTADPAFASLTSTASTLTYTTGANTLNIDITAPVDVAHGGTGRTSLTNHGVLVGASTSAITQLAVGATNTVLLGSTGADPSFGAVPNAALTNSSITLSSGTRISITGSPVSLGGTATVNASPAGFQTFTTNGTFTTPSTTLSTTVFKFTLIGAGGGGGGTGPLSNAGTTGGGAGGAGGMAIYWKTALTASLGCTVTVSNSGGTAGANTGGTGGTGGNTSIVVSGVTVTAGGGGGGVGSNVAADIGAPGSGGTCTNGTLNITGATPNRYNSTTIASNFTTQNGGNTVYGVGGVGVGNSSAGSNGVGFGSGGSGSKGISQTGGAGAPGLLIVEYW